MSMTLKEAIKHAEYIVNNRKDAISVCWSVKDCQQIAAWLRELQERREKDNCYGCKHKPFEEKRYCRSCKRICLDKYEPERRTDGEQGSC